jgi:hypothetical protein
VIGIVIDSVTNEPIMVAEVSLGEQGPRTTTDANGRFALEGVPL